VAVYFLHDSACMLPFNSLAQAAEEDDKLRALEIARMGETAYMTKVKETLQKTDAPQW